MIDSIPSHTSVRGVFVVRSLTEQCPNASPQDNRGCGAWRVLARVTDVPLPAPSAATSSPTPTTAPPATPVAEPSGPLAPAPVGLLGSGNRPLTEDEFATLWAADPNHLAGRIVIAKGPVPEGFECAPAIAPELSTACGIVVLQNQMAPEGYWAVLVGADGRLSVLGEIALTKSGGFVFTVGGSENHSDGLVIVDGWLDWEYRCDVLPTRAGELCGFSLLTAEKLDWMHMNALLPEGAVVYWVQPNDAWTIFGATGGVSDPVHGLFLVQFRSSGATILARLQTQP